MNDTVKKNEGEQRIIPAPENDTEEFREQAEKNRQKMAEDLRKSREHIYRAYGLTPELAEKDPEEYDRRLKQMIKRG